MSINSKTLRQFINIIDDRIKNTIPFLNFNKTKLAEVVSNDGTTLTIAFLDDLSTEIPGVPYLDGQTIIAQDKILVIYLNNSPKSNNWLCIKLA